MNLTVNPDFQTRVRPWMRACFGAAIAADREERNHRFLEESLELVQACGATQSEAHQLVDYVFSRPLGERVQEVGGAMLTLAALCLAQGIDMHAAGELELARVWTKLEQIRAKQAAKPKHSPLPEVASVDAPTAELAAMEARKDAAYLERNQVVAALAKAYPSGVARTAIEGWSEDWHGCVYIDLPTGQASWHFHDSHAHLFAGLPTYAGEWDGHSTELKYSRLAALTATDPVAELSAAARDVLAERERQVSAEGWTPEHDDEHVDCSIPLAAATYAVASALGRKRAIDNTLCPWESGWLKSTGPRRDLIKAGALILAEVERLDRATERAT